MSPRTIAGRSGRLHAPAVGYARRSRDGTVSTAAARRRHRRHRDLAGTGHRRPSRGAPARAGCRRGRPGVRRCAARRRACRCWPGERLVGQQFQVTVDAGQRRAQLVRDRADQVGADAVDLAQAGGGRPLLLERIEQRPLGLLDRVDVLDLLDHVGRHAVGVAHDRVGHLDPHRSSGRPDEPLAQLGRRTAAR